MLTSTLMCCGNVSVMLTVADSFSLPGLRIGNGRASISTMRIGRSGSEPKQTNRESVKYGNYSLYSDLRCKRVAFSCHDNTSMANANACLRITPRYIAATALSMMKLRGCYVCVGFVSCVYSEDIYYLNHTNLNTFYTTYGKQPGAGMIINTVRITTRCYAECPHGSRRLSGADVDSS